jgi:peroxiredoxin
VLQVVDLQRSGGFKSLGIELLSIAGDEADAWRSDGERYGVEPGTPLLTDAGNRVAERYDVMRWQAATGEPSHTFVLVDRNGRIAWIRDFGAPEHGGIMYVVPDQLVQELAAALEP